MSGSSEAPVAAVENDDGSNVKIAFAVTIGAGAATALGAAVVFVPSLVRYAQRKTLAGSLGLSAGVMMYVSFVEIFQKSRRSFVDSGMEENVAYSYATVSFFGGVIFMMLLNSTVTYLLRGEHYHAHGHESEDRIFSSKSKNRTTTTTKFSKKEEGHDEDEEGDAVATTSKVAVAACACCSDDPVEDLEKLRQMARALEDEEETKQPEDNNDDPLPLDSHGHPEEDGMVGAFETPSRANSVEEDEHEHAENKEDANHSHDAKLMRMSINTAIAIALHNFPEGLATFVATLNDPKVGGVLGLAIAIHNIPEGLCVAMPVYYATGKRWNAFAWGTLSGISEPIAAVLGYAVLANSFSDVMYAVLFGMVAGMMVIISTRELLPTGHRYDPEDSVVTYSFIAGMGIIALSLVLFLL